MAKARRARRSSLPHQTSSRHWRLQIQNRQRRTGGYRRYRLEKRANDLLEDGLKDVRQIPFEKALRAPPFIEKPRPPQASCALIHVDLPAEAASLRTYHTFKSRISAMNDMPDRFPDLLFRLLWQNGCQLLKAGTRAGVRPLDR